jgi:hypothetical protein
VIFIWGLLQDPATRAVHDLLQAAGAAVTFVNHAAIARTVALYASDDQDRYRLVCEDMGHDMGAMSAAYLRPYDHRHFADNAGPDGGTAGPSGAELVHHLIGAWAEDTAALVINRPSAEATNRSKLLQARLIHECGFFVPESLVTNDVEQVRAFQARHGSLVYKSMSNVRSVVQELDPAALEALAPMAPVLFQQRLRGGNVRVHVVGETVFACAIQSDRVDYRYSDATTMQPISLAAETAERCTKLTRHLGLTIAGLDLIVDQDGQWHCLEVNPNPAFSVFERRGANDIARCVADLLLRGSSPHRWG